MRHPIKTRLNSSDCALGMENCKYCSSRMGNRSINQH